MIVAGQIREKIECFPTGYVFTLSDFGLDASYDLALAKLLSRMSAKGEIVRVAKGKYYKPKQTIFGALKPAYDELVKDFLIKNGKMIGYISGVSAFSTMGLTTQISNQTQNIVEESALNIQATMSAELQDAKDTIMAALGSGYCIYDPNALLIVDTLPKENARNVLMINNNGIAFGQNGISGAFTSAWTIDGTLNMQAINVINLTANLIKGGTLKLGSETNQQGQIEVYDEANTLIAELNANGLKVYGQDGSYVLINQEVGFAGYDRNDNPIYWVSQDEFHQKKAVVEQEITLCNKVRFIPITINGNNNTIINKNFLILDLLIYFTIKL